MAIRKSEFIIYDKEKIQQLNLGYVDEMVSLCILNNCITAFSIKKVSSLFSAPIYRLHIHMTSVFTSKDYGYCNFDTLEEATEAGINFIKKIFPVIEEDIKL